MGGFRGGDDGSRHGCDAVTRWLFTGGRKRINRLQGNEYLAIILYQLVGSNLGLSSFRFFS